MAEEVRDAQAGESNKRAGGVMSAAGDGRCTDGIGVRRFRLALLVNFRHYPGLEYERIVNTKTVGCGKVQGERQLWTFSVLRVFRGQAC
jgi:hypothetical protein